VTSALETLKVAIAETQDASNLGVVVHLEAVSSELKAEISAPTSGSRERFAEAARLLHRIATTDPSAACFQCCFAVAEFYFFSAQAPLALQPIEDAVICARAIGDDAMARLALNMHGVLLVDTGNYGGAIECYAEALDFAARLPDSLPAAAVWSNLGLAMVTTAAYHDGIACLELAIALTSADDRPAARRILLAAQANAALAHLHLDNFGSGLRRIQDAIEAGGDPRSPQEMVQRTIVETIHARLLLEVKSYAAAKERVAIAKHYALTSKLERGELDASMVEGLVEVHSGQVDVGLSRLYRVLERARVQKGQLRDVLIATVKAHEVAGKHDVALVYLRELMMHTAELRKESALMHQRLHLERLDRNHGGEANTNVDVIMEHHQQALRNKLAKQVAKQEIVRARTEMLERLAITAELRDDASGEHCFRVGRLASLLAQEYGSDDETCAMIDLAARLHDVGKVGVPDGILLKRGRLNDAEMQIVRAHATIGAELLAQSNEEHLKLAEDIARFHHEWWNGSGYPFGIGETAIPLAARITALADVFDTLTHDRVYRARRPMQEALDEILKLKGKQFDPHLTDLLIALVGRLQREVGDLDAHLGMAATQSTFIRARRKIADTLRRAHGERPPPPAAAASEDSDEA
jgi:putative two-component system response regulator